MTVSFKARFALLVAWQFLILFALAGSRWAIHAHGRTVLLATAPVDPRDIFRGEYVALRYDITSLDPRGLTPGGPVPRFAPGETVYVVLVPSSAHDAPWKATAIRRRPLTPEERSRYDPRAVSIRGDVVRHASDRVEVRYGIESYFVPEGEALPLERAAGRGLTAEVRVDAAGRAALHRLLLRGKPIRY